MSGRTGFLGLALLASLLATAISWEWQDAGPADEASGIVAIRHLPKAQPRVASEDPEDRTDEWLATALARPLFSRDRRPTPPDVKPGVAPVLAALPRLTGIVVGPFGRTAIFAGADGAKPVAVAEGKSFGPFTVEAIRPGGVTVSGPQGERLVSLSADAGTRSTLAAELPPPPAIVPSAPALAASGVPQGTGLGVGAPGTPFNLQQRLNLRPGAAFRPPVGLQGFQPSREGSN